VELIHVSPQSSASPAATAVTLRRHPLNIRAAPIHRP
jgi:hypothetical protein